MSQVLISFFFPIMIASQKVPSIGDNYSFAGPSQVQQISLDSAAAIHDPLYSTLDEPRTFARVDGRLRNSLLGYFSLHWSPIIISEEDTAMDHFFRDLPSDCGHLLQVHHLIAAEKNVDPLRHDWVEGMGGQCFFFFWGGV